MLGKLMKYEIKATARTFLPLFGVILVFSVINRLFYSNAIVSFANHYQDNWILSLIFTVLLSVYALLLCTVFVLVLVVTIQRFYKNLLGDQGYLMFTLPVPTWFHIVSKMLIAGMWALASLVVALLSVGIMVLDGQLIGRVVDSISYGWGQMAQFMGISSGMLTFEAIVYLLISIPGGILPIYCAIAIGQLWQKHRIFGAFCAYIGINTVSQIISGILANAYLVATGVFQNPHALLNGSYFNNFMMLCFILAILMSAVCFIVTNLLLQRKLNLE